MAHAMKARLVYDGGDEVRIPEEAGKPRADQMQGTALERVCELGGRLCYDSLGKGRNSADYHKHIKEVGHTSVHEHAVLTVEVQVEDEDLKVEAMASCLNRRGVYVRCDNSMFSVGRVQFTANLRAVNEWDRYTTQHNDFTITGVIGWTLKLHAANAAPAIVPIPKHYPESWGVKASVVGPGELSDYQAHVSLYIPSSRVVGEEFIRHRYSPSKRSTRYCDESESPWVMHPLLEQYLEDKSEDALERTDVRLHVNDAIITGRDAYKAIADKLEAYLVRKGIDKTTARKQARGAARSYLGLGLATEKLFTAPVSGWRDILRQRLHPAADAEMRAVAASVLDALRESRYRDRFADLATAPSPDGLGVVLA